MTVATDCSGIEAPMYAMREMGIATQHAWACDCDKNCQEFIKVNFASTKLYNDILKRDVQTLPKLELHGYVAGFPCQPFSRMNSQAQGFRDKRAKVLGAVLGTIKEKLPKWAVLENVVGILQHRKKLLSTLKQKLGASYKVLAAASSAECNKERPHVDCYSRTVSILLLYNIRYTHHEEPFTKVKFCPTDLLDATCRPRVFFLLIRSDVAISSNLPEMLVFVFNAVVSNSRQALIQDKILPTGHALLAKWGLSRNHLNDREQQALDEAVAKRKVSGRGFVADVSQRVPQQCCSAIVTIHLQRPTK
jgi:hypothetical protein